MEVSPDAASPRLEQPLAEARKGLAWPLRISVAWLLAWTGLALWAAYGLATAWPYEMHPLLVVLALALPGVVFRTADLLFMRWRRRRLAGWWRTGGRLAALPLGVALAFALFSMLEPMSMARFEREIAPWVSRIHAIAPMSCQADGGYPVDAALASYLERSGALRKATLHHGNGRFVIELAGRSIDIDGSTLYYESATRKWNRFHNDNRERSVAFEALVKPLAPCRFTLS
ncbi:MAG: hypothetical protein IPL72_08100 [Sulfuritalea sp.]|nr:hypothetical protein [Sulfuritalea sp.]